IRSTAAERTMNEPTPCKDFTSLGGVSFPAVLAREITLSGRIGIATLKTLQRPTLLGPSLSPPPESDIAYCRVSPRHSEGKTRISKHTVESVYFLKPLGAGNYPARFGWKGFTVRHKSQPKI